MKKVFSIFLISFVNLLLLVNVSSACNGHTHSLKDKVEEATNNYLSTHFFNAVYEVNDGAKVLVKGANGVYSHEDGTLLKVDQQMPVASVTKSMTAAAILKLQDKGLLNVRDSVAKHLNEDSGVWKDKKIPAWAEEVTIHNLLTHTSGLPEYFMAMELNVDQPLEQISKDIANFAASKKLAFKPGSKVVYTNTNFVLLGVIIEKISGKTLGKFFEKELFKPLGMNSTRLASLDETLKAQRDPKSVTIPIRYFVTPTGDKPQFNIAKSAFLIAPYADGGVISTAADLIKWHKGLHEGKVMSEYGLNLMKTKHYKTQDKTAAKSFVGYGLFIAELENGDVVYHHAGSAVAIRCESGYIPAKNLYYAVISNVMNYVPKEMMGKVDMTNPKNQLDIHYFAQQLFEAIR